MTEDPFVGYMEWLDTHAIEESAWPVSFHDYVVAHVYNELGPGDPLDLLLRDSFYRMRYRLEPRQL